MTARDENLSVGDVFRKYRVYDRVRFTARDGSEQHGSVLGNIGGHLTVVPDGALDGIHIGYKNVVLVEANPSIPLEART